MDISVDKIQPNEYLTDLPLIIVDSSKAGALYFVQHKPNQSSNISVSDDDENLSQKKSHHSFAIDITGKLRVFSFYFSQILFLLL